MVSSRTAWNSRASANFAAKSSARAFNEGAATCDEFEISVVTETEIRANESGTLDRVDLRICRCKLEFSLIERVILRDACLFSPSGASQYSLKTHPGPEAANVWAEETFHLALDVHKAAVLTTASEQSICNAACHGGKTTARAGPNHGNRLPQPQ